MSEPEYKIIKWNGESILTLDNYKHTNPVYHVKITIYKDKTINILFYPYTDADNVYGNNWYFDYDVAVRIWKNNRNNRDSASTYGRTHWKWGSYDKNSKDLTITDFKNCDLPIYIEPLCQGCDSNKQNCAPFIREDDSTSFIYEIIQDHEHIEKPNPPTIISVTATKVKLSAEKGTQIGLKKSNNNYEYKKDNGNGVEFDKVYDIDKFITRKKCSCGTFYQSNELSVKYWTITSNTPTSQKTYHQLTFKATHKAGTNDTTINRKIVYDLYKITKNNNKEIISKELKEQKKELSGFDVLFTDLDTASNYRCEMYTEGIPDNKIYQERSTDKPYEATDSITDISLGEVKLNLNVKKNKTKNLKYNIYLVEGTITNVSSSDELILKKSENISADLNNKEISIGDIPTTNAKDYTIVIVYKGTSESQNDYSNTSETITTTHFLYFTSISRQNANINISVNSISSKSVVYSMKLYLDASEAFTIDNNTELSYCITNSNVTPNNSNYNLLDNNKIHTKEETIDGATCVKYYINDILKTRLTHDTKYWIHMQLKFKNNNEDITYTGLQDFTTKKLSVTSSISLSNNEITISYKPYLNNKPQIYDNILVTTGEYPNEKRYYSIYDETIYLIPNNSTDIIDNDKYDQTIYNGITVYEYNKDLYRENGDYISSTTNHLNKSITKKFKTQNLIPGYTYILDYKLTDGVNNVGNDIEFKYDYDGYIYIFHNGSWKKCVPYIFHNGSWKKCSG